MSYTHYRKASWNGLCQACQFKFKAEELTLRWDGLRVCKGCFEVRHPQDFIKIKADKMTPPWTSPRPADVFIEDLLGDVTSHVWNEPALNLMEMN